MGISLFISATPKAMYSTLISIVFDYFTCMYLVFQIKLMEIFCGVHSTHCFEIKLIAKFPGVDKDLR